jgi:hypothetical protein
MLDALAEAADQARGELVAQGKLRSNYMAWLIAASAVTTMAGAKGRGGATDRAINRAWLGDLHEHVLAATHDDGWEWEGSTYYHGFVLRAYLLALRGTDPAALPEAVGRRIAAMIAVVAAIATPGGVLPALHDGPYESATTAAEWTELCVLADQFVNPSRLSAVFTAARAVTGPDHDRLEDHLRGWFTGPPRPAVGAPSTFGDVGYAVVRTGGVQAVLDAGPHGGSHGHRDKLALYLYGERTPWQPDPGQVPYASPLRGHYASTCAHPAFAVDGLEQAECGGALDDAPDGAVARCDQAYAGVRATRRLVRGASYLLDVLHVAAGGRRRIEALLRPGVEFTAVELPEGVVRTKWNGAEELAGWHVASPPAAFAVGPGYGTADGPQRFRSRVDWSADAESVTFVSVYQAAGSTPAVTGVRLVGAEVHVTLTGDEGAVHALEWR